MNPVIKYTTFALLLLVVVGVSVKKTIHQQNMVLEKGCFIHYVQIDTTQKSVVFPRLSSHLFNFRKTGKALLTTISDNYTRSIPMKEWLALERRPNKQVIIKSTLVDTWGTVKIQGDTLTFTTDKLALNKIFIIERTNNKISKLKDIQTNEIYLTGTCDPNL